MTSQHIIEHLDKSRLWYTVLTSPYAELKTKKVLEEEGFITYLPINKIRRQWAKHIIQIHTPLMARCVFVYATNEEIEDIQKQYTIFPLEVIKRIHQNQ